VLGGISVPEAAAAKAKPTSPQVSADSSVVKVPRRTVPVQPGNPQQGTGRPQVKPPQVSWPHAGSARVAVPAAGAAAVRIGSTAVSVAQPQAGTRAAAAVPSRVEVTAYDEQAARRLGGHGTALRVVRADGAGAAGRVGIRVDVSGFAGAFGGGFESRLRLLAEPACALDRAAPPSGGSKVLESSYQLRLMTWRSMVTGEALTIRTTRPINPTFESWLNRWGVAIDKVG
jgi:hypothetical protein